jgi:hypothetical protein
MENIKKKTIIFIEFLGIVFYAMTVFFFFFLPVCFQLLLVYDSLALESVERRIFCFLLFDSFR